MDELTRERFGDVNFAAELRGLCKTTRKPSPAEIDQRRADLLSNEIGPGRLLELLRWWKS